MRKTTYWAGIRREQDRRNPHRDEPTGIVIQLPPVRPSIFTGTAGL